MAHLREVDGLTGYGGEGWYCKGCGTEWNITDLLEAMNEVEQLACVLATVDADQGISHAVPLVDEMTEEL